MMVNKRTKNIDIEMGREARFWFEERYPDDWPLSERMESAMLILEDVNDIGIDYSDPPAEAHDMAFKMNEIYTAARTEYTRWKREFLENIGPEMDV